MASSGTTIPANGQLASDRLVLMDNTSPAFVRVEGRKPDTAEENKTALPLPLFVHAEVLEISAPFANRWYHDFWKDLREVGPQHPILRDRRRDEAGGRGVGEEVCQGATSTFLLGDCCRPCRVGVFLWSIYDATL